MGHLSIKNLKVCFHTREGTIRAVEGIDLAIEPGEIVGLVGESGSGSQSLVIPYFNYCPDLPLMWMRENLNGPARIYSTILNLV